MVLEYLFFDKKNQTEVELFNQKIEETSVGDKKTATPHFTYNDFDGLDCWILKCEIEGQNEVVAKKLSEIGSSIIDNFAPKILTDECSEYFNKSLYPLVNKFERLLRKFLYLKAASCKEDKLIKAISDIEKKDFGDIYTILFVDSNFRTAAREKIKKLNTRAEMFEAIDALQESTAWHILVGDSVLSIIKDNFDIIRDYRNDVMHAHNINYERHKKTKKLFKDANSALETQINLIYKSPTATTISDKTALSLYDKLTAINRGAENLAGGLSVLIDILSKFSSPEPLDMYPGLKKIVELLGSWAIENSDTDVEDALDPSNIEEQKDE